jgi:hypothetical protein
MTSRPVPNIEDLDVTRLLGTEQPVQDMPLPSEGPFVVVERLKLRLETWQQVEAEAEARGVEPHQFLAQLIEAAMSPALQQLLTQLTRRTPPAA